MAKLTAKKKKVIIILSVILGIILLCVGSAAAILSYAFGSLKRDNSLTKDPEKLGVTSETQEKSENSDITNIALFGLDTRAMDDSGRSDAIIILSIDKKHNSLKLSSIARDTYASVEGYGKTKINHAYAYGGAELAIKTLNQNFDMDIEDYVSVNFEQLANVIDYLGGVTVNITEEELEVANEKLASMGTESGLYSDPIPGTGDVQLNGLQAVAYSRVREVGGDTARTSRQREVLEALFNKAKSANVTQYPAIINKLLDSVQTSLSYTEIMDLGMWAVGSNPTWKTTVFPNKECNSSGQFIGDLWYYVYDLDNATDILHRFIYDDIQPEE